MGKKVRWERGRRAESPHRDGLGWRGYRVQLELTVKRRNQPSHTEVGRWRLPEEVWSPPLG